MCMCNIYIIKVCMCIHCYHFLPFIYCYHVHFHRETNSTRTSREWEASAYLIVVFSWLIVEFIGCGKTTITVAAVRSAVVRKHFECVAWQAVSQIPNIPEIQARLFMQLFGNKLPDDAATDVGLAFKKLQEQSRGRTFLVVLDDVRKT